MIKYEYIMASLPQYILIRVLLLFQAFIIIIIACQNVTDPYCLYTTSLPSNKNFMASVGNGYLGSIIMSDSIHVAGIYNGKANFKPADNNKKTYQYKKQFNSQNILNDWISNHTHRARIPSPIAINFTLNIEGERSYSLDLKHGVFYQYFKNQNIKITQQIFAHRVHKNLLINIIEVHTSIDINLNLNISNSKSEDIDFKVFEDLEFSGTIGSTIHTEHEGLSRPIVAVVSTIIPSVVSLKKSKQKQILTYITSIATSVETSDPIGTAVSKWREAVLDSNLLSSHEKEWEQVWSNATIEITGNLYLSQITLSSLYAILSSSCETCIHGISPGGLPAGYEYLGHVFWDQETWMYPSILMFYPKIAKAFLQYRYERKHAAEAMASKYGFKGLMFPWESAVSGLEVCPEEVYGRNEIHISGDIIFALKQYYHVTKDMKWLKEIAFPLLYGVAVFWQSRVTFDNQLGTYTINDVMPPDEYQYPVNNSVYTNVVAKATLESAIFVCDLLKEPYPTKWNNIVNNIIIPFDKELQYHPEFDGFDIKNKSSFVKQADTILINYPLQYPMKESVKANDLQFYSECTDVDGPAMTNSMFTIGWLDVGQKNKAKSSFEKNFDNIQEPFKVWSEIRKGAGAANFITAAGGYLQSIVFGYFGVRIKPNGLEFSMTLLPDTSAASLNGIKYLDFSIKFSVTRESCYVVLIHGQKFRPLFLKYGSTVVDITDYKQYNTCNGSIYTHE